MWSHLGARMAGSCAQAAFWGSVNSLFKPSASALWADPALQGPPSVGAQEPCPRLQCDFLPPGDWSPDLLRAFSEPDLTATTDPHPGCGWDTLSPSACLLLRGLLLLVHCILFF